MALEVCDNFVAVIVIVCNSPVHAEPVMTMFPGTCQPPSQEFSLQRALDAPPLGCSVPSLFEGIVVDVFDFLDLSVLLKLDWPVST